MTTVSGWWSRHGGILLGKLRVAYLALLLPAVAWLVVSRRSELGFLLERARPVYLLLSLGFLWAQLTANALFWRTSLAAQGHGASFPRVWTATARSVLSRYVPGSVWYAVSRVGLLARRGVGVRELSATAVLEVTSSFVVAAAGGSLLLALGGTLPRRAWLLLPLALVVALAISPPVFRRLVGWAARLRDVEPVRLEGAGYLRMWAAMGLFWALSCGAFYSYLAAFPSLSTSGPVTVLGAYMAAWAVGLVVLFAPQGLGVFEVTLAGFLGGDAVFGVALLLGGFRALMLVRDVVTVGVVELVEARETRMEGRQTGSDRGEGGET